MLKDMIKDLVGIVGEDYVVYDQDRLGGYLYDETEEHVRPEAYSDCVVVKPANDEEVASILKLANQTKTPVIIRGGGTGAVGAAIPQESTLIVSMERFKKIIGLDKQNMMITVQTAVTLAELNEYIAQNSDTLCFPIHPGDESAHAGGMAVENAGGVSAVKHGIMRNYVKGMKVVLPDGQICQWGGKLLKNNMGLDLMHLVIGSEGTLCVITEVTLTLFYRSDYKSTLLVSFEDSQAASGIVPLILQSGIVPQAIEYLERDVVLETAKHMGMTWPVNNDASIDLMFVIEENSEELMYEAAEKIVAICEENGAVDTVIAESDKDQRNILEIRSNIYTAYKEIFVDSLDTAVPPANAAAYLAELKEIAAKYGAVTPAFGHLADGNFHNMILQVDGQVPAYTDDMRRDFYAAAIRHGGTISAEHGTGRTRKPYMGLQFTDGEIELMKRVKLAFDPNNILNPGAIFD